MKILGLGNCQIIPLFYYIKIYLNEDNWEFYTKNIVIDLKEHSKEIDELISSADIIIQQNFYKGSWYYNNETIKSLIKDKTKILYIHTLYFEGYFPDTSEYFQFNELFKKQNVSRYETPYLDFLIFQGYSYTEILQKLEERFNKEEIDKNLNNTLNNLYERENGLKNYNKINVPIYDFIKQNFRKKLLFNTCNHPTNFLLNYYACEIIKYLFNISIEFNSSLDPGYEFLGGYSTPIYPSTQKHLNLDFVCNTSIYKFKNLSFKEYISLI